MPGYSYNEYKYLQGLWCPQEGNFCGESNGGGYDQTKFVIIILPRECLSMGHGFTVRCHFIEKQHELCHPPLPRRSSICASSAREQEGGFIRVMKLGGAQTKNSIFPHMYCSPLFTLYYPIQQGRSRAAWDTRALCLL